MVENIKKVSETATVTETQKIYMLGSSCINPQEGAWCVNRMIELSDPADTQKKTPAKTVTEEIIITMMTIILICKVLSTLWGKRVRE